MHNRGCVFVKFQTTIYSSTKVANQINMRLATSSQRIRMAGRKNLRFFMANAKHWQQDEIAIFDSRQTGAR
jgi:hypothetical protein